MDSNTTCKNKVIVGKNKVIVGKNKVIVSASKHKNGKQRARIAGGGMRHASRSTSKDIGILQYLDEYTIISITMAGPIMLRLIWDMMRVKGSFNGYPLYQPEFVTSYTALLVCEKGIIIPQFMREENHSVLRVWLCDPFSHTNGEVSSMIIEGTTNITWATQRVGVAKLNALTLLSNHKMSMVLHEKEFTHYTSLRCGRVTFSDALT